MLTAVAGSLPVAAPCFCAWGLRIPEERALRRGCLAAVSSAPAVGRESGGTEHPEQDPAFPVACHVGYVDMFTPAL